MTTYTGKLFRTHKGWFLLVLLFLVAQLFIGYKNGFVASPFYNYGMYSRQFPPTDTVHFFEIQVNGKTLLPLDFSSREWDKLLLPVQYLPESQVHNQELWNDYVRRLFTALHIKAREQDFVQSLTYAHFMNWYKTFLARTLRQPVNSVTVTRTTAVRKGSQWQLINREKLEDLCQP
jgi:hypothetical protein